MTATDETVPRARYRDVLARLGEDAELLEALALFTFPHAVDTVRWFDNLVNVIDQRLGELEKRLDAAGVPRMEIPDDECERYFTLPMLSMGVTE
jgi:type VI protein secretion system component VasK